MRKKIIFCLLILFWFINKDKKEYFINNQENIYSNKLTIKNIDNIKKGQKIMSNMLKSVDILCINNNINYWCLGGTLIGVLRHKGWIPWDADIDIGMLEKDYNNFKSVVNQLPNNIHFSEPKNKPCFKLRSAEAKYTYADWAQKDDLNKGIQLDIFLYKNNNGIIVPHKNNYLGNICGVPDKKKRFFNDIFPLKREKFEDFLVYIPNKYKKISEEMWGGYPPKMIPREKRLPHEGNIQIIENNFSNTKIINNYGLIIQQK
jgi:phosphorylcholine metabolism protein LicD